MGRDIAPHCCISSRQSRRRNLCGFFAKCTPLSTHSPTKRAISRALPKTSCVASPTATNRLRLRSSGFTWSQASVNCASMPRIDSGRADVSQAPPVRSTCMRSSCTNNSSELSHSPRFFVNTTRTVRPLARNRSGVQSGFSAVTSQVPPNVTRISAVDDSSTRTSAAQGNTAGLEAELGINAPSWAGKAEACKRFLAPCAPHPAP